MKENPKFERLLKLLMTLSNGVKYSASELTDRYQLSKRTFYRDIDTLRNAGFAVECKDNVYWIEKLEPPFNQLHDLLFFTEEEAHIITQAIHNIDENNVLKENLVNKLYELYRFGKVAENVIKRENSKNIHQLSEAIDNKHQVILRSYRSANSQVVRDRLVEPFDFSTNYVSVWAFDPGSRSNKLFKTARIETVDVIDQPQQFTKFHQKQAVDVFRISGNEKIPVTLNLTLRAYNLLIEEYPLSEEYISHISDNKWQFKGWVANFDGIARFALGLCEDVEIVAPQGLKGFILEKVKHLTK